MENLQTFVNQEFGEIRTLEDNGRILFCGSDVANSLGYAQPHKAVERHCKGGGTFHTVTDSLGRHQKAKFITEGNLYRLISNSKLPTAEHFELWVFDEVLPQIRKTGGYIPHSTTDTDSEIMAKALLIANKTIEQKDQTIIQLSNQIEEQKPSVDFAKTVQGSDQNILVRETSKLASNYIGLDIGEKGLYQILRRWKLVCKHKNEPTQLAHNLGVLEYVERAARQFPYVVYTTMVTPHGQIYIVNRLIREILRKTVA